MAEIMEVLLLVLKVLFIVFFFGFCIFIHEFGHLIVAMWRGLHIERFSVGFGKPIKKWRIKNIDYVIGWLPFGGYVALPQLDPSDSPKSSDGADLPAVAPLDRTLTAVAGPLFNILFGFLLACVIWVIGIEGPAPATSFAVGYVPETYTDGDGDEQIVPEYKAGLQVGDIVVAINGESFQKGWQEALEMIVYSPDGRVQIDVTRNSMPLPITYNLVSNPDFEGLGYPFFGPRLPTRVGQVMPNSPAAAAGLETGDILLEINGEKVANGALLVDRIQQYGADPLVLKVKRMNRNMVIADIQAEKKDIDGEMRYLIGIGIETAPGPSALYYPSPWTQFTDVLRRTYKTVRGLIDRKNPIRPRHMSGPVGIFHMLYVIVINAGFVAALNLIIFISFSLAILNLLPLPILDGGHITLGMIEMISGRRVPTQITLSLSYAFIVILLSFMLYVTFHDAKRVGRSFYSDSHQNQRPADTSQPNPEPAGDLAPASDSAGTDAVPPETRKAPD